MANLGKTQLTYVIIAPPEQVKEGDRIFASHGPWMKGVASPRRKQSPSDLQRVQVARTFGPVRSEFRADRKHGLCPARDL